MFVRFDEIPSMTLQNIKGIKRYGGTDGGRTHTHARMQTDTDDIKTVNPSKNNLLVYNQTEKNITLFQNMLLQCIPVVK